MKLKDARDAYYDATATVSNLVRGLGFFGIGLVFTFRGEGPARVVPELLKTAAFWIAVSLGVDLLQYLVKTAVWGPYHRLLELRATPEEKEFLAPRWLNWPGNFLFWSKIITMGIAYYYVLRYLGRQVF